MLPSDSHVNQRQLTYVPAQNRTVGIVQRSCRDGEDLDLITFATSKAIPS